MLTMILGLISSIFLSSAQHFTVPYTQEIFNAISSQSLPPSISISVINNNSSTGHSSFAVSLDYNLSLSLTSSGSYSGSDSGLLSSFGQQFYFAANQNDQEKPLSSYNGATIVSFANVASYSVIVRTDGYATTAGRYTYLITASDGNSYLSNSTVRDPYVKPAYIIPYTSGSLSTSGSGSFSGSESGSVSGSANSSNGVMDSTSIYQWHMDTGAIYYPLYLNFDVSRLSASGYYYDNVFCVFRLNNFCVSGIGGYAQTFFTLLPADGLSYLSSPDFIPTYSHSANSISRYTFSADRIAFTSPSISSIGFWILLKIVPSPNTSSIVPPFIYLYYLLKIKLYSFVTAMFQILLFM